MNLFARARKLRKMSPGELRARLESKLQAVADRRSHARRARSGPLSSGEVDAPKFLRATVTLVPGADDHVLKQFATEDPAAFEHERQRSVTTARQVLSGSWTMLGHEFDLRGQLDWHSDPRSGFRFPQVFYGDVAYGGEGPDVKYVWELGRQQYLVELARGWRFERADEFAERARDLMLSWISDNPALEGVHWTSALEVSMRSISWIWTLATSSAWAGWTDECIRQITASLADHAEYLSRNLSFYSSPYNHLVGEAAGLFLISLVLQDHPRSSQWNERARSVLLEHGPRQFYEDGFTVEQASGYHFFTLGFLTMAVIAARQSGTPLTDLEPHLHRAFVAGAAFRQPDGRWPAIGDLDSARSIPVFHDDYWCFDSLCHTGAVLFAETRLKVGRDAGAELIWLTGNEGLKAWSSFPPAEESRQVCLSDSGYTIASDGSDWLCFDAGPIAHGLHADGTPSTAHGHLDVLQVLYCLNGQPVLTDSGIPFYAGDANWIRHFRGPMAHNTLEIEGETPAHHAGRLEWSHVLPRPELQTHLSPDAWLMSARARWGQGTTVERNILCLPGDGLWIADLVRTDRPRSVTWHWQLPEFDPAAGLHWQVSSDSGTVGVTVDRPVDSEAFARRADGYGVIVDARRKLFEVIVSDACLLLTSIGRHRRAASVETDGIVAQIDGNDHDGRTSYHTPWKVHWEIGSATGTAAVSSDSGATELQHV